MRALTISSFAPWWGEYPVDTLDREDGQTVGGGEENFLRCTASLKERGHDVVGYHCGEAGIWRGTEFRDKRAPLYTVVATERFDAVAEWSSLRALEVAPKKTRRLFVQQLNDLMTPGRWDKVDCVVSPSRDHAERVREWNWKGARAVVHNGVDLAIYADARAWNTRPMWVGYWHSPDRGLHHLLRAWEFVLRQVPEARLHVFYEIDRYLALARGLPNMLGDRARLLSNLIDTAKNDKSVVFHGAQPRKVLARIQKKCRVNCYPYDPAAGYCEGFGTSVLQGLAAGCNVLTTRKDAFPSLYGDAVDWLTEDTVRLDFHEYLAGEIVEKLLFQTARPRWNTAAQYEWEDSAKQFEAACEGRNWF